MTTWGSQRAEDMFRIAVLFAGIDGKELMLEIHRRSPNGAKVKESTVLDAMQAVFDRYRRSEIDCGTSDD